MYIYVYIFSQVDAGKRVGYQLPSVFDLLDLKYSSCTVQYMDGWVMFVRSSLGKISTWDMLGMKNGEGGREWDESREKPKTTQGEIFEGGGASVAANDEHI